MSEKFVKMKEIMAEREQAKLEQMAALPFYVASDERKRSRKKSKIVREMNLLA